jgi:hypothetical protein
MPGGYAILTAPGYATIMLRKYQAVFTSRWKALWWAAGVCLTAYCTVPSAEKADQPVTRHEAPTHHLNPWSIQPKG